MHVILPFASSLSEPCQHALSRWTPAEPSLPALPHLRALLGRLSPVTDVDGDEYALSMPHERLMARLLGWPEDLADGTLPWAGRWAREDGLSPADGDTWAMVTPGHWLMGRDHLTLIDPDQLQLDDAQSRALFDTLLPYAESDGWRLHYGTATRWYLSHDSLAGLPTASLDRVIGRNPDLWLTDHAQARTLRRLQSEAQMLWYQHPLHDERQARGQLPVNSFWVSGCGHVQPHTPEPDVQLDLRLRSPLLGDDMPAWVAAWQSVDDSLLAQAVQALDDGQPVRLTLCGDRMARTWQAPASPAEHAGGLQGWWQRWRGARKSPEAPALADVLSAL